MSRFYGWITFLLTAISIVNGAVALYMAEPRQAAAAPNHAARSLPPIGQIADDAP